MKPKMPYFPMLYIDPYRVLQQKSLLMSYDVRYSKYTFPLSFQVASSQCSSARSSTGSGSKSAKAVGEYPLCGPHPIKITVAILLFLSVWTAIILGAHVHKKVNNLDKLLFS